MKAALTINVSDDNESSKSQPSNMKHILITDSKQQTGFGWKNLITISVKFSQYFKIIHTTHTTKRTQHTHTHTH